MRQDKNLTIRVGVNREQRQLLQEWADRHNLPLSTAVRALALTAAKADSPL